MRVTDIPLNWVLPSAVLLLGALAAVVLMTNGRNTGKFGKSGKTGEDGEGADSWERMEERRRRKETVYGTASYVLLFCCAGVAAALSFHGLVGFGRQNLNLSGGWEYLVPFGLDGAAMFSAVIAVREASHGDASLGSRLLVWVFAAAAAWFNWVHAPRGDENAGAPQFFAGMSLSAAILFDRALKQTRRAALREQGLVPRPLPQIRAVRWVRAPRETFGAWSLMLLEGVRTLDEAVDEVREDRRQREQDRNRRRDQDKLERARIKALHRQHRIWHRGRQHVEVEVGTPAPDNAQLPVGEVLEHPLPPARPALQAGVDSSEGRGTRKRVEVRTRDSRSMAADAESAPFAETADTAEDMANPASPRLDSLEEKLAQIERQFG